MIYGVVRKDEERKTQGIEIYQGDERGTSNKYIGTIWFKDLKEVKVEGYISEIRVQVTGKAALWLDKLVIEEGEREILPDHLLKVTGYGEKLALLSLLKGRR